VEQNLTTEKTVRDQADELVYSHAMDLAIEHCHLETWSNWTSRSLEPQWRLANSVHYGVNEFRKAVFVTDWPGRYPELEVALDRLSFELQEAVVAFAHQAEPDGNDLYAGRLYKPVWHTPETYERLDNEVWDWSHAHQQRIIEATKAANWAREV
jgi:hypothetical protein